MLREGGGTGLSSAIEWVAGTDLVTGRRRGIVRM